MAPRRGPVTDRRRGNPAAHRGVFATRKPPDCRQCRRGQEAVTTAKVDTADGPQTEAKPPRAEPPEEESRRRGRADGATGGADTFDGPTCGTLYLIMYATGGKKVSGD